MEDKKTMEEEYTAAMKNASVMAFIQVVGRHPTATLGEVSDLAKKAGIGGITVGQLFVDSQPKTGAEWADSLGARKALSDGSGINTRTPAAREEYDLSVVRVLAARPDAWLLAPEIRASVGGTPLQVRTSLNRLLEGGRAEYKGQARATSYQVIP